MISETVVTDTPEPRLRRLRRFVALPRLDLVGGLLLLVYLLFVLVSGRVRTHLNTGDSNNLVRGTRAAIRCLSEGTFSQCGQIPGGRNSFVHAYPLLQYIPTAVAMSFGVSDKGLLRFLATLNWVALIGAAAAIVVTFRRRSNLALIAILAILVSSMTYQVNTAFGESLAGAMVVLALCAAIRRRPMELFILMTCACLGKETLAPFVVVLALVCARSPEDRWLPKRNLSISIGAGAIGGISFNSMFNIFRFGTIGNRFYMDPAWQTPGILQKLKFGIALVAAPSGGIIWYWPVFSLLAIAATTVALRRLWRAPGDVAAWLPLLATSGVVVVWLASLSAWWAPFGWVTYGPRLDVPLLAGAAVAFVHLVGEALVRTLQRSCVALAMAIGALGVGMMQFGAPWRWPRELLARYAPGDGCPGFETLDVHKNPQLYYQCVDRLMWRQTPIVSNLLNLHGTGGERALVVAALGLTVLVVHVRRSSPPERSVMKLPSERVRRSSGRGLMVRQLAQRAVRPEPAEWSA